MQNKLVRWIAVLVIGAALGIGVAAQAPQGGGGQPGVAPQGGGQPGGDGQGRGRGGRGGRGGLAPLLMETDAFPDGGIVPAKYAGRGGVQPGFKFSGAPDTTVSYAIIFHDIDVALMGGTDDVLHWMVWNIPASAGGIPEGKLPEGAMQNQNYFGPGAPAGPRYHHYVFELYALNSNLELGPKPGRPELLKAMEGKVVAKSAYVGRFRGEPAAAK
jgi:Raf kinase inhibitor-like YbhB/YbcL family protein